MTLNFKRPPRAPVDFCIFGKLPRRSDFVRVNAAHPGAVYLDGLVANSLKHLPTDSQAVAAYRQMPSTSLVMRHHDANSLFLGALQPSYDEAGRNFPLVAGAFLVEGEERPPLAQVILAKELFFSGLREQLLSAVDNSVEMLACRNFLEEQSLFNASYAADLDLARQLLDQHLQHTTAAGLQAVLSQSSAGQLDKVLLAFIFQQQLSQKFASSLPSQIFLLPLPDRDGEDILFAAMWLALYQAATETDPKRTEQFLLLNTPKGRYLALVPGHLLDQHFSNCWGLAIESSYLIDVSEESAPWRSDKAYVEAAYVLGRRLCDQRIPVSELRDVIRNIAQSIV